ncbi:MAG: hypothetical protein GXO23_04015 [Crenarchaeota archaeon]|nr:hypothetical protein [Thermoproteota archaeon]
MYSCTELKTPDLPNSARYIVTYLKYKHLVECVDSVTFRELVEGTGLSPRTVRKAISMLRDLGLIRIVRDVSHGRRHLYQLNFKKLRSFDNNGDKAVNAGVYLIDVGIGLRKFMNPKALSILFSSEIVFHTDNVPDQVLDLVPEGTEIYHVSKLPKMLSMVNGKVTTILIDGVLDEDYARKVPDIVRSLSIITCTSPITYAAELLRCGRSCRVIFRRTPIQLQILSRRPLRQVNGEVVKCIKVELCGDSGDKICIEECSIDQCFSCGENVAYVIYLRPG